MEKCTQYLIGDFICVLMFHPQNKWKGVHGSIWKKKVSFLKLEMDL
jgi:hypothetical protein